jgi:hypothetical protein
MQLGIFSAREKIGRLMSVMVTTVAANSEIGSSPPFSIPGYWTTTCRAMEWLKLPELAVIVTV